MTKNVKDQLIDPFKSKGQELAIYRLTDCPDCIHVDMAVQDNYGNWIMSNTK